MENPGSVEPEGVFTGLSAVAIGLGIVVDHVLTLLTSIPLVAAFGTEEMFSQDEAVSRQAFDDLFASGEFLFASLAAGLVCTVVGAFVGSRRAGAEFLRHGGWIAVLSAVFGLVLQVLPSEEGRVALPLWVDVVPALLLLPAGLLGGALAARVVSR